jgi:transketolase
MRNHFANEIIAACHRRDDVFVISGDAGLGVLDELQEVFPRRYLNLGIAEQNATSFAAGLSLSGRKVVLYNIIPFLLFRCYEQIRNDICYQNLPVVLVGTGSGITYAPQGVTHYAVEDLGLCATLPNLTVISPGDPLEAAAATRYGLDAESPVYVRLAKSGEAHLFDKEAIDITTPRVVRHGDGAAIVFHGSVAPEALAAADSLAEQGISPKLVSLPMVQPLNEEGLMPLLEGLRHVVVLEEHFAHSGLGHHVLRARVEAGASWQLHVRAIPDHFIHAVNHQKSLRSQFGIDAAGISRLLTRLLG